MYQLITCGMLVNTTGQKACFKYEYNHEKMALLCYFTLSSPQSKYDLKKGQFEGENLCGCVCMIYIYIRKNKQVNILQDLYFT